MENQKKSNLPFIIIGAVLLVALVGAYFLFQGTGKTATANNSKTNSNANKSTTATTSNVPGASPAWSLGSPSAAVTIEEFADFQCPTCGDIHPKIKEIRAKYGDRVRIIFRHFPLTQIHPRAYDAAVAAEAAGLQGKFWDMQNLLFTNQKVWTVATDHRQTFEEYAKNLGLDVEKFKNDMAGINTKNRIDADIQRGNSLSIRSTPSIFINGKLLTTIQEMEVGAMSQMIDAELQKAQPASTPAAANTSSNSNSATTGTNSSSSSNK